MTDTPTPSSAATPAIQPQHLKAFYEYPHPVDVYSVVTGAQNVPQSVLKPDLEYVADAQTVREATERSYKTIHRWMHSGLFKNVNLNFEPLSQEGMSKDEKAQTDRSVVAHFSVDEARMNRIEIGVSTTTTMVPEFNASVHNLYGRPLSLSAVLFPAKSKVPSGEIRLRSQMPYVGRVAEHSFGRRIENRLTSNRPVAIADSEVITELKSCLAFGGFEEMPTYTVTASISDRNLAVKELSSLPPELAAEYKSDTKLALRFTAQRAVGIELSADEKERNRMNLPVRGAFGGVAVEAFAAVDQGPTASPLDRLFVKGEAGVGLHKRLCSFLTLDLNALGGAIWSASETARVPLSDRFYLSDKYVRGYRSIGPNTRDFCEERNLLPARVYRALGGNAVWAASASLNFPLSPNASMVCGHLFANAGSVIEDWRAKSVTSLSSLFASPTASIGVGVVATLPAFSSRTCGRLEANLSVPLQWQQQGLRVAWDYNANLFQRFRFGLRWSNVSVGGN